jgi:hypothetical protein
VTPLARDRVRPDDESPAENDAASHPGAENYAEDRLHRSCRAVGRFRQSKTVGVIGQTHRAGELGLQVLLQWAADQPCGVCVLDNAGNRRNRPGHAEPDARRSADRHLDLADERNHCL